MNKNKIYKLMNALSILMLICAMVFIIIDYINYDDMFTSAPFYVNIIVRSVEFLLPAIMFFIIGYVCKKKYNK